MPMSTNVTNKNYKPQHYKFYKNILVEIGKKGKKINKFQTIIHFIKLYWPGQVSIINIKLIYKLPYNNVQCILDFYASITTNVSNNTNICAKR